MKPGDHESYAARIWRHFRADLFARIGLGVVVTLFVLAALAPFLANSHAIVRVADGRTSFPVFASLEPIEWRFLLYVPLAGFVLGLRRILFRRPWGIWLVLATVVAIEIALAGLRPFNDPSDDRTRPASFKILAPIAYSPAETSDDTLAAPSWQHPCGTDFTGRDIATRMLHGGRISLAIGFVSQVIALAVGVTLGGVAGYYRGWIDIAVSRFIEIIECFPSLLLILVVIGLFQTQNNIFAIMAVIGLTSWTGLARLVRGEFLRLSARPFTLAAHALGATDARVIVRHLLPNALGPVLVSVTFGIASAILIESSLSFLGFGIQAPTPSWGDILSESRQYLDSAWWLAFFPGGAILVTIMAYNFVGEGLRDAIDPRLNVK
jgi:peptide/nickel transport system permease protein